MRCSLGLRIQFCCALHLSIMILQLIGCCSASFLFMGSQADSVGSGCRRGFFCRSFDSGAVSTVRLSIATCLLYYFRF